VIISGRLHGDWKMISSERPPHRKNPPVLGRRVSLLVCVVAKTLPKPKKRDRFKVPRIA
jgi:hypothetical protein